MAGQFYANCYGTRSLLEECLWILVEDHVAHSFAYGAKTSVSYVTKYQNAVISLHSRHHEQFQREQRNLDSGC